jgi:hypothetical protein
MRATINVTRVELDTQTIALGGGDEHLLADVVYDVVANGRVIERDQVVRVKQTIGSSYMHGHEFEAQVPETRVPRLAVQEAVTQALRGLIGPGGELLDIQTPEPVELGGFTIRPPAGATLYSAAIRQLGRR